MSDEQENPSEHSEEGETSAPAETDAPPRRRRWRKIRRYLLLGGTLAGIGAVVGVAGFIYVLYTYGRDLPDLGELEVYEPPVTTRVHAGDGTLLAEYARQKRLFVPIEAIPPRVKQAFLAAEDKKFYEHGGLDYVGIVRAAMQNVINTVRGRRLVGGSTITQQVAKNFLLTSEVSYERKIKEALLALRIERAFTKDEILELYLNEIYLGSGAYGVAAASFNYFRKSLDELTLDEAAFLAALPKAPNNYHPIRRPEAAVARRNWVIGRMYEDGWISKAERREARAAPLSASDQEEARIFRADYFSEEIRRELSQLFGDDSLYEGGLSVRTTLDPDLQALAENALQAGLIDYDRRHGWRGPVDRISPDRRWQERLNEIDVPLGVESWELAVVISADEQRALIGLKDGSSGVIPFEEIEWARPWQPEQRVGPAPKNAYDVLSPGDVVPVERLKDQSPRKAETDEPAAKANEVAVNFTRYGLRQIPEIEGALVAMDPHTGRVLAMVGGYSYAESEFNRAVQAKRQPGSAFKPVVYAAALDSGMLPTSLILDAPFVIEQGQGLGKWKPENYTNKFYGPSTLRLGIEKSRNLMTVRLAQRIGMERIVDYADRLDVIEDMPAVLSMALGAGETTLIDLTAAYGMFVNGGKEIDPTLIDRIQNRRGRTIYRHDDRECRRCRVPAWRGQPIPTLIDERDQLIDPATAYQVVSLLEGVVERGTGVRLRQLNIPIAGKTGTTNDAADAWFLGFTPNLVAGVYVGFDEPRTLGPREQGASAALPIFKDFMETALAGQPAIPFRIPPGIQLIRVNAETGAPAQPGDSNVILEAFKSGQKPGTDRGVLDGSSEVSQTDSKTETGTGTIY